MNTNNPRGQGVQLGNIDAGGKGAVIENNLFARSTGNLANAISLDSHHDVDNKCVVNPLVNVKIRNNTVFSWYTALSVTDCTPSLTGVTFTKNVYSDDHTKPATFFFKVGTKGIVVSENDWYTTQKASDWYYVKDAYISFGEWQTMVGDSGATKTKPELVDSSRSIETYMQSIGLGSTEADYFAAIRKQRRGAWNTKLSAASINGYFRQGFARKTSDRGVKP